MTAIALCLPGTELVFDTRSAIQPCLALDSNIPCVKFTDSMQRLILEFHPTFLLQNLQQNFSIKYSGDYRLRVVAGGASIANLANFSTEQGNRFNPSTISSESSWIFKSDSINQLYKGNEKTNIRLGFLMQFFVLSS
jgi:hypothetical protein